MPTTSQSSWLVETPIMSITALLSARNIMVFFCKNTQPYFRSSSVSLKDEYAVFMVITVG